MHVPFADISIASLSKPLSNTMLERLQKPVLNARDLNCKLWIFHLGLKVGISMFYLGKEWIRNLKTPRPLFKFAIDHDIEAAIENDVPLPFIFVMKSVEDFKGFHSQVKENIDLVYRRWTRKHQPANRTLVKTFGDKIVHIHAHDNYGESDQHLGIGHGNFDWNNVVNLLRGISSDMQGIVCIPF